MKEFKIEVPEGMEIDLEASDLGEGVIKFKCVTPKLPMKWEDLDSITGFGVDERSALDHYYNCSTSEYNKNIFPTLKDANSSLALAQLLQLRKAWVGDWTPVWEVGDLNWIISRMGSRIYACDTWEQYEELSFPTEEMAEKFKDTFRDLIKTYYKL